MKKTLVRYKRKQFPEKVLSTTIVFDSESTKTDEQILRTAIGAEISAINLYQQLIDSTGNLKLIKILQDIINEEKIHVGELEMVLNNYVDIDNEKAFKTFGNDYLVVLEVI